MIKKSFAKGLNALLESSLTSSQNTKKKKRVQVKKIETKSKDSHVDNNKNVFLPKYKQLLKVNVLLEDDQKVFLDNVAMTIMRKRSKDKNNANRERITTNSVVRSWMKLLEQKIEDIDYSDIENEEILTKRLSKLLT